MRVLLTAGGTEEPLDGVRCLSNRSTGSTGRAIAGLFASRGATVTLLHAERMTVDDLPVTPMDFRTFDDLASLLRRELGSEDYDAVIHLAAVGDYRLESIELDGEPIHAGNSGKIGSGHELLLRLAPNPKLIDRIRSWSRNPEIVAVGFKLTNSDDPAERDAAVAALLARNVVDFVVHNDIREIRGGKHPAVIHGPSGPLSKTSDKNELAGALFALLATGERP